jgi:hypothetical protein
MKFFTRTIIALVILSLVTAGTEDVLGGFNSGEMKRTVSGNTGVGGVVMKGSPGDTLSDERGNYIIKVGYGWSGTITPVKEGYTFEPATRQYTKVVNSRDNDDYKPKALTYTISGNAGVRGAMMQGLPGNVVTDQRGFYTVRLPYGWSGVVKPEKSGYTFRPAALNIMKIMANHAEGNFDAVPESSDARSSDPYGSFGSSRSRSGRRGSARGMDPMYGASVPTPRGRSSGYKPAIRSGGRKALVIPAGEIKPKELAETIEDMHVMSHILDERFKETRRIQGMFTDFGAFFGRDSRSAEATYLQGFGVLFLMEVNFTFSPPPRKQAQDPAETTEAVDSTWLKARQRVLSPGTSPGIGEEDSARDYGNQMVEELKKELVEALKHASNIRNVKPDEWVILTVIGGQRQFGMSFGGGFPMGGGMSGFGAAPGGGPPSDAAGGMGGGYGGGGAGGFVVGGYGDMGGMMGAMAAWKCTEEQPSPRPPF